MVEKNPTSAITVTVVVRPLLEDARSKKGHTFSSSFQLPIASHLGVRFHVHLSTPCGILSGLTFHRFDACYHTVVEFICTAGL